MSMAHPMASHVGHRNNTNSPTPPPMIAHDCGSGTVMMESTTLFKLAIPPPVSNRNEQCPHTVGGGVLKNTRIGAGGSRVKHAPRRLRVNVPSVRSQNSRQLASANDRTLALIIVKVVHGPVALGGQQRVEFDGGLGAAKGDPHNEREAEVNGGGIQRLSRRLEFKAKGFISVERGACWMSPWAKSAKIPQSRFLLATANVLRAVGCRMPA